MAKFMIPFGKHLLHNIYSLVTRDKLAKGNCNIIKESHGILIHNNDSLKLFLDCVAGSNFQNVISLKQTKEMWKKLTTKLFIPKLVS